MAVGVSDETHKIALFFHWLFKVSAEQAGSCHTPCALPQQRGRRRPQPVLSHPQAAGWAFYIVCTWFIKSFVLNFVICIVLIALDFWTVSSPCRPAPAQPAQPASL